MPEICSYPGKKVMSICETWIGNWEMLVWVERSARRDVAPFRDTHIQRFFAQMFPKLSTKWLRSFRRKSAAWLRIYTPNHSHWMQWTCGRLCSKANPYNMTLSTVLRRARYQDCRAGYCDEAARNSSLRNMPWLGNLCLEISAVITTLCTVTYTTFSFPSFREFE